MTRVAGVASIAAGMVTVITITALNAVARDMAEPLSVLGFAFPMDTDYIAIPAVVASVSVLVVVSLVTPRPREDEWREFVGDSPGTLARKDPRRPR